MTHEAELLALLNPVSTVKRVPPEEIERKRAWIEQAMREIRTSRCLDGLHGKVSKGIPGPVVTQFILEMADDDDALCYEELGEVVNEKLVGNKLAVFGRKPCWGMDIPNEERQMVSAGELFHSPQWKETQMTLPLMLGMGAGYAPVMEDLASAPHLLIAGATGSGKSVFIDSCICSLLLKHTPDDLKLVLVDPKWCEFGKYKNLPYLQFPVINSVEDTLSALQWLKEEMDRRFAALSQAGCRNIRELNDRKPGSMPYIVLVINELADLMCQARKQALPLLCQIAVKCRAAGIHLIISTQRPGDKMLPDALLANFPTRVAFQMNSSRLLGSSHAGDLLGCGDMLFKSGGTLQRIQGAMVSEQELSNIINHLQDTYPCRKPNASPPLKCEDERKTQVVRDDREMLLQAARLVVEEGISTISGLQRKLKIGYNQACELMAALEQHGIISEDRTLLVTTWEEAEKKLP